MSLAKTMSMGDHAIDVGIAEMDREESRQERMRNYTVQRANEVFEKRIASISSADVVLALEIMSTQSLSVVRLMEIIFCREDSTAQELREMVKAALLRDSIDIAIAEFKAMEAEPPSRERH
jgi:hypothetical protein